MTNKMSKNSDTGWLMSDLSTWKELIEDLRVYQGLGATLDGSAKNLLLYTKQELKEDPILANEGTVDTLSSYLSRLKKYHSGYSLDELLTLVDEDGLL
ncbi:hypothetical protein [Hymenobacter actinosclerus]|uniref:Uncharacterized protein n=1 Tax=Hymenobacter actinosclerus TaxID=82805 RepID=A0A1I0IQY5_9BACT|nr:hypothetical protein [Hymenobacter actinosclerus]SET99508.1 hypothetical protein SAMN04487998_3453 [Hymenobacter actinosclerus]